MKHQITIVADNKIPFLKGALEPFAEVRYLPASEITNASLRDVDALITRTRTNCNANLLDGTAVKFIATATIGFDHIDDTYCREHSIKWVSAPGCNSSSVMQYIGSALLTIAKRKNLTLSDCTIGIVGVGNVGKKVARLATLFGMNVLCNDPPRMRMETNLDFVSIDEIMSKSDIITFHVPLNKEGLDKTYHLADDNFFAKVKKGTVLINTSRGSVVETHSLKKTIKIGTISSAVLDVWESEPNIDRELLAMVDIATPHIAGYSADGKANGTSMCVHAVSEFFKLGVPTNWYPVVLLPEDSTSLAIDCKNKTYQENLYEAILPTYQIMNDDARLRTSPETFEQQRSSYPIRREYPTYELKLNNPDGGAAAMFRNLGFTLKQ